MSIHDERELRQRLGGLLDAIEPSPAPVARTARQGRGIRMRRWISVAAGLVLIAAGAVVIPGLIQQHTPVPAAPMHYKVTVTSLGPNARSGVVGEGTIDNKRWRVVLTPGMGAGCSPEPYLLTCGLVYGVSVGPNEVSLNSASANGTQFELGTVGADVTRVTVQLSNGTEVDLTPVAAGGRRWVAFAAPLLTVREAVSFVGSSEYRYAIPYVGNRNAEFVTWLRPGQRGLARVTRQLGSGVVDGVPWHASAEAGPWGYCVTFANGSTCMPAADGSHVLSGSQFTNALACGPAYGAGQVDWGIDGRDRRSAERQGRGAEVLRRQPPADGGDGGRRDSGARVRDPGGPEGCAGAGVRRSRAVAALGIRSGLGVLGLAACAWLAG